MGSGLALWYFLGYLYPIMARRLKIEFPGAIYHITARGNARLPIFKDDHDRKRFLGTLWVSTITSW